MFSNVFFTILIDGCIHKKAQQHRCRSVYSHTHRGHRITQIETAVQLFCIIQATNRYTGVSYFSVDIWSFAWIISVEGNTVKCCRQALSRQAMAYIMKTAIGTFRPTFACKHSCRIFSCSFKRVQSRSIRKLSRNIFLQTPS